ncbi:RraA family protein [Photobacterium sp. CCB-ST2H9]|uniref:RraA family protein n=1 Tax=Photobacterium sp. CCB-ST2H9 TaxID=2912855 RepID=UPI0020065166|nr:RraA family protein [Photobacterium sp. CCB-ST2H9]UTM56063.1 RraA family protein [Photobacterium sp. CCB-ST2H9]
MELNFSDLATTDYGNVLSREHFFDLSIRPLWQHMKRISGPAYPVQLAPGDNLMLHSAIYSAPEGSIVVVDGVDCQYAVAGGNVCAVAKERGIQGFIIDGVIRDLGEITKMAFPVYAKGVFPVPGKKQQFFEPGMPIVCGGVRVCAGDMIVADMEGIVAIPQSRANEVYQMAKEKLDAERGMQLAEWEANHRIKIQKALEVAQKRNHSV